MSVPKWASVYRSTSQTILNGVATLVSFSTSVEESPSSWWIPGDPTKLTVPVTGFYIVQTTIAFAPSIFGSRVVDLLVDALVVASSRRGIISGADPCVQNVSIGLRLTAGQVITVSVYQNRDTLFPLDIQRIGEATNMLSACMVTA